MIPPFSDSRRNCDEERNEDGEFRFADEKSFGCFLFGLRFPVC